jgi:alpha-ribazole phosphatase
MTITLIRHTSVNIPSGICYGQSDVDVSGNFEFEAPIVKDKLTSNSFDAVYSSPLQRCEKLARYCGFENPTIDNRLMEINFGNWEMKAWEDITDPQLNRWYQNWVTETPTNGESLMDLICRVDSFIVELKKRNHEHVAIFTHAGVIRSFGVILEKFSAEKYFDLKVNYGDSVQFIMK